MPLPPKEFYILAEVAERWGVPVSTIQDYLFTDRLEASVYLPSRTICHYTKQLDPDSWRYSDDEEPYIYDIDFDDPDSMRTRQGLFTLLYKDIEWDENGKITLQKGDLFLTLPDDEGYFGVYEPYVINRDEVVITLSEINRFEAEHDVTPNTPSRLNTAPESNSAVPSAPVPKLHTKEKESLLKMIIVLAAEAYRYNPNDKKSTVPGEIASSAQQLGLSIDVDTVRKWLKEAASLLPREEQLL